MFVHKVSVIRTSNPGTLHNSIEKSEPLIYTSVIKAIHVITGKISIFHA
jgi:hypothetical protein